MNQSTPMSQISPEGMMMVKTHQIIVRGFMTELLLHEQEMSRLHKHIKLEQERTDKEVMRNNSMTQELSALYHIKQYVHDLFRCKCNEMTDIFRSCRTTKTQKQMAEFTKRILEDIEIEIYNYEKQQLPKIEEVGKH